MKELKEAVAFMTEAIFLWLGCILQPARTVNEIVRESKHDRKRIKATQIFLCSSLIGLIVGFPGYSLFGISYNNIGFYLTYWTATTLTLLATGIILHYVIVLFRLKSVLADTVIIYTILASLYNPVLILFNYPSTLIRLSFMQNVKKQSHSSLSGLLSIFHANPQINSFLQSPYVNVLSSIAFICSALYAVTLAEAITQMYGNDRFLSYSSVAISLLGGFIALGIFLEFPFQTLIEYSSIQLK